jgi:hypothetical protein
MTLSKILEYFIGDGREDNKLFTIDAGDDNKVTLNFKSSGIDTATTKYYDLRKSVTHVGIIVNKVAAITEINGRPLSSPITLGTDAQNTWTSGISWNSIKVRADVNATTFEVQAR